MTVQEGFTVNSQRSAHKEKTEGLGDPKHLPHLYRRDRTWDEPLTRTEKEFGSDAIRRAHGKLSSSEERKKTQPLFF